MAARSQLGAAARPRGVINGVFPFVYPFLSYNLDQLFLFIQGFLAEKSNGFLEYLRARYVKDDYRLRYSYIMRNMDVVRDPTLIKSLTPSQAHHLLNGLAALRDFIRMNGYYIEAFFLDQYIKELRKIAPRRVFSRRIIDEEENKPIIDRAIEYIRKVEDGKWRAALLVLFFTGLRSTEVIYLFNNYDRLRKLYHCRTIIVELNYIRKSKKAWITMIPDGLEPLIQKYMGEITNNTFINIRNKKKIQIGIFRDAHLAILSETMRRHEINLLQGRVSEIDVKHYTKHIRRIAEKYNEAYKKYYYLISP